METKQVDNVGSKEWNERADLLLAVERLRQASKRMGLGGSAVEYHGALVDLFDLAARIKA